MSKIFMDEDFFMLHECRFCLGTGAGTADGIPCWLCNGSGMVDNRPELDYEDEREIRR